jgi:hypothetical protein
MIDWSNVATGVIGSGIVGVGGLLVSKVNKMMGMMQLFTEHLVECKIIREETGRRLDRLERMAHVKHEGGNDD